MALKKYLLYKEKYEMDLLQEISMLRLKLIETTILHNM